MLDAGHGGHGTQGGGHGQGEHSDETDIDYNVPEDAMKLYKKIMKAVPIKTHIAKHKTHIKAYSAALNDLVERIGAQYPSNPSEAEEILADALIKYRTEAKHPAATTDPEARHYVVNHIRMIFEQLQRQGKVDVEDYIKAGRIDDLFKILADHDKKSDLDAKVSYEIGKLIPHNKEPNFYQNLVKAYGKTKNIQLSEGDIATMGNRDHALGTLLNSYQQDIEHRIKAYKPKGEHGSGTHGDATAHH